MRYRAWLALQSFGKFMSGVDQNKRIVAAAIGLSRLLSPLLVGVVVCSPTQSSARTVTSTFTVSVTTVSKCTISASAMAFGNYTGIKIDTTTTLTVTCTKTTPYQIGANDGLHPVWVGGYAKYMLDPSGSKLRYHLYPDAARSIEWGTTAGSNEVPGTGTGVAQTTTVYGTVGGAGMANYTPGLYSDTVTLTINF